MYEVDVNGTHNVLEAAARGGHRAGARDDVGGGLRRVPGQPGPDHRGAPGARRGRFSYARDKTESDRIVQLWALQHPDVITTIVRPCIVYGPNVDNYLVRLWSKAPMIADVGNIDSARAVRPRGRRRGGDQPAAARPACRQFNLAADGL